MNIDSRKEKIEDYRKTVLISASKEDVFKSLTKEISNWWGNMDEIVRKEGDIFTISWGEPWFQFKVIEYNALNSITWECIDCNLIIDDLVGIDKEWVGTKLQWNIKSIDKNKVEVSLVHQGLIPEIKCYKFCSSTWDSFIGNSLKNYLEGVES